MRVVRGEVVPRVAKRADPQLAVEINTRVRIEARGAPLAPHRVVRHGGHVWQVLPRRDKRAERHHALRRLDLAVGPDVPGRRERERDATREICQTAPIDVWGLEALRDRCAVETIAGFRVLSTRFAPSDLYHDLP